MNFQRVFIGGVVGALLMMTAHGASPGDVAATFDSPCRYPAGLAADGEHLYVLDWRSAKIHVVSPTDGSAVRVLDAPTLRPSGITAANGRLMISDDHTGKVHVFNPQTGVVETTFAAPGEQPVGLAYADDAVYLLEGRSGRIYKVLPEDGTILAYFDAPSKRCTCLAFDGRYLWATDRYADELYRVDPQRDGMVVGIIDTPGAHPTGIDWAGGQLWNVDFQTRKLYRLNIATDTPYALDEPRTARVTLEWTLYNYGPGAVRDVFAAFALPMTLPQQTVLSEPEFTTPPTGNATDRWGQQFATYEIPSVAAGERMTLSYSVDARVSKIRYLIDPDQCGTLADIPGDIRAAYTADGARYRVDSPFIREAVQKIVGDERNPYWIARKIFNHMIHEIEYEMVGGWDVPEVVLKRGTGSCSEYTFALIALCRAAGLPARYQGAIVVRGDDASIDEAFHRWAQVYLPNYGWVPVDANAGDKPQLADQARGFGELSNRFLITTQNGGASEQLAWGYNVHATWQTEGYANVAEENFGYWEPLGEKKDSTSKAMRTQTCE